eukprot:g16695.t1
MEVLVPEHPGLPDDCVVSIRCGGTRRQAPLGVARGQAMKFPCRIEALTEPPGSSIARRERRNVSLAVRVRPPSSDTDSPEGSASEPTPKMPGAGARDYLELHGVLKYVQSMLTALIQTRPQDPYLFMLHQLKSVKAYCEEGRRGDIPVLDFRLGPFLV